MRSKNSAHVPFTGKPLRASKNLSANDLEIECSKVFHQEGIPLLVSPLILRSRDLGQIDLARIKKMINGWNIEIGEVKSSHVGTLQMERFQKKRLHSSQNFLSSLFGYSSKLITFTKKVEH